MNFIIRSNNDSDGIVDSIIIELKKQYHINKGFVLGNEKRQDTCSCQPEIIYKNFNYVSGHYFKEMEQTKNLSIPRNVIDKMVTYKPMCLDILMRETHYDIYRISYLEDTYYRLVQFWYNFLIKEEIDFVLFLTNVHLSSEYVLYSLTRVMSIKILELVVFRHGYMLPCDSISHLGDNVIADIHDGKYDKDVLNKDFDKLIIDIKNGRTYTEKELKKEKRETQKYLCYYSSFKCFAKLSIKYIIFPFIYKNDKYSELTRKELSRLVRLSMDAVRHEASMDHFIDYDRLAVLPDYNTKYVYYALQQTPEETTMPRAGEYKNQLLSILTLAEAANRVGLRLYIKEHWVQPHRKKGFYKRIAEINNVFLIDNSVSSADLIDHAVAVSSQTGTCILEAAIKHKPSLYFGEACVFRGIPGSHFIVDSNQAALILNDIIQGRECFSMDDVLIYLKALQGNSVRMYIDNLSETSDLYDRDESAKKIVQFISTVSNYRDNI